MNYFHITWVTHNSRISNRMIQYSIEKGEPIILSDDDRKVIYSIIKNILEELDVESSAHNVLSDHVHIVIKCSEQEISNIVRKLKSKSTYLYELKNNIQDKYNLWAQKYNSSLIKTEKELENVLIYVENNHLKHKVTNIFDGNKGS